MKRLFLALTLCLVASPALAEERTLVQPDQPKLTYSDQDFEKAMSRSARYANAFLTYPTEINTPLVYTPYGVTTEVKDDPVVLTPTKLYDLITETRDQTANVAAMLKSKLADTKRDIKAVSDETDAEYELVKKQFGIQREEIKSVSFTLTKAIEQLKKETDFKLAEIERRLIGVQGQVTVLHGKKADK